MSYPKTAADWWKAVEENKQDLLDLISSFHPYYRKARTDPEWGIDLVTHQFPITAERAEKLCEGMRESIANQNQDDPQRRFEKFLQEKNTELARVFSETWWGMPESSDVRCLPGFGVLCDLCSEEYVLHEDNQ